MGRRISSCYSLLSIDACWLRHKARGCDGHQPTVGNSSPAWRIDGTWPQSAKYGPTGKRLLSETDEPERLGGILVPFQKELIPEHCYGRPVIHAYCLLRTWSHLEVIGTVSETPVRCLETSQDPLNTGSNPQGELDGAGRRPGHRDPWGSTSGRVMPRVASPLDRSRS